jgi:hypothetical protein
MKSLMIWMLAASCAFACTVVDPDDRAGLRERLAALPPPQADTMTLMTMNAKTIQYLNTRDENDQVGKYECRVQNGPWSQFGESLTVQAMLKCLRTSMVEAQYVNCAEAWQLVMKRRADAAFKRTGFDGECRFVWDFRYQPEKLPPECTDPDAVTLDDTIDAMIASDVPPPLPGGLPPGLIPLLCPLAEHPDAWGCPDSPGGAPGQNPGENPPGGDR